MNHVYLHYTGGLKKVSDAVNKANKILGSSEFYEQIRAYKQFDSSALSPEQISRLMEESGHRIEVVVNWIIPNVRTRHNKICVSGWDFSNNLSAGVNNLIYETVNSIDCLYDLLNSSDARKESASVTAPWVIGTIAEVMTLN